MLHELADRASEVPRFLNREYPGTSGNTKTAEIWQPKTGQTDKGNYFHLRMKCIYYPVAVVNWEGDWLDGVTWSAQSKPNSAKTVME
ncbi:hypothetical protein PHISCL_01530 [Aspergillus sclerotialis]|uniref:Uncharacterized protein n=1 Tax=Aspergillus sclerotialis TaxID=2070753 RepID=A0A3A2ZTZ5_9EURO|nr:hypothetical protein PHISCL_01530 [Aspergillus sclerotialis]